MLGIHQRYSAGTSLVWTLADLMGVQNMNARQEDLLAQAASPKDFLRSVANDRDTIWFYHLEPMYYDYVATERLECLLLVRHPYTAFEAGARHLSLDNKVHEPSSVPLTWHTTFQKWRGLADEDHICLVEFEKLVVEPTREINRILEFYGHQPLNDIEMEKKRYTGVGLKELTHGAT